MTLILASIRPDDVVLTADGRSNTLDHGKVVRTNDHVQKLFPILHHPLVLAHMGENDIAGPGISMKQFLHRFTRGLNTGNLTVLEIADRLRDYAHAPIRARFEQLGNPAFGVNFWVVGFSYHEQGPRMVEVFWKRSDGVLTTEERHFAPITIVPGGSGQNQIPRVDWHRIDGKPLRDVIAYHHTLMDQAIHADIAHNGVGGAVHELVIKPAKWKWRIRPPQSAAPPRPTSVSR